MSEIIIAPFVVLLPFILVSYVVSVGVGALIFKKNGIQRIHKFWIKMLTGSLALLFNMIAGLLKWLAKVIRT